jgi:hypothetical protein
MTLAGFKKIIREIFSEPGPNGTLSWGRVAATITLFAAITWVTRIVLLTHALPDLSGATAFGLSPYVANKGAALAQSFSQNPVTPNQSQVRLPLSPPPPMILPSTLPPPPPMFPR